MTTDFLKQFKAARRVSTPLISIGTPDPAATIALVLQAFNGTAPPVIQWDLVRGLTPCNTQGEEVLPSMSESPNLESNPTEMLSRAANLPKDSCLFMHNANRWTKEPGVAQAAWNLRDVFKQNRRTLVMLSPSGSMQLPGELAQDVLSLDEPLPSVTELEVIVKESFESAGLTLPNASILSKAVDALAGLAAFPAEQVTAMSLTKNGLDLDSLWERKRSLIGQTPGLSVWRGGETFDQIGGCENVKSFMLRLLNGAEPPMGIVFIDEIEKAFAGSGTDLSGTTTEMTGTMLSWMQDNEATGAIFIGPPGAAKSAIAKATGNTANVPTIAFDLSGMKGSLVGESGANLRRALKVVQAVTQGRALFIATCNSIGTLPPELRRRFKCGTFFFDLPSESEREAIWKIYCKKYKVGGEVPYDDGWTGAEIRTCCEMAWRLKSNLKEAAAYIVPVAKSAADQIEKLRNQASGRFISASDPGMYRFEKNAVAAGGKGRSITMEA